MPGKLSIIIPAYNEEKTLEEILRRVASADIGDVSKEILVIDDGSQDGTRAILESLDGADFPVALRVFFQPVNLGKGAAIQVGIKNATGNYLVVQDADLEYDPREYPQLLGPILDGRADVVYGSRFLGGPHRVLYYWHFLGNQLLTLCSNMLSNLNLSDMETCYKVFRREVFDVITIRSNRFEFEPEVTMKIAKEGFRVYETPISYSGRSYAEGKKITWKDGVKTMWALFRFRFSD
jgi:glycosyltransferase involved in cell wall biosynthesis